MPSLTVAILCVVLAVTVASSSHAQAQPNDSAVRTFMDERSLDQRHGAWFRQYQVDPLTDSVRVHQWLTWAMNSSLSGFRQPMSVALGFMCQSNDGTFFLTASDTSWHFAESKSRIRYRVDQNQASDWQQGKVGVGGHLIIAVLDSAQSATLLAQMISGRERVVIRVREGPEEDFYFLIKGFHAAYLECRNTRPQ